jgi:hypothetical protein
MGRTLRVSPNGTVEKAAIFHSNLDAIPTETAAVRRQNAPASCLPNHRVSSTLNYCRAAFCG